MAPQVTSIKNGKAAERSARAALSFETLADLAGAHPRVLGKLFAEGTATDPAELGEAPSPRVLVLDLGLDMHMLLLPLSRALRSARRPWSGVVFDHGGNAGQHVVFGRKVMRFRAEVTPSVIDGRGALALTYEAPAFKNLAPVRAVRDELRTIAPGVALGHASIARADGGRRILFWFGLERARS